MSTLRLLLQELRRAVRSLARAPGFALAAVAVFALGLGASTTIWSAVHALLLAPLPFAGGDRLVALHQVTPEDPRRPVAPANFLDWRRQARSYSGLAAWNDDRRVVTGTGEPRRLDVAWVSSNLFDVLGARAASGRLFHAGEQGTPAVVSARLARQALGRQSVAGAALHIDGWTVHVVGVAPPSLDFPPGVEMWVAAPRDVPPLGLPGERDAATLRDARYLGVVGRLAPGVTPGRAQAELSAIARRLEHAYPAANAHNGAHLETLAADLGGEVRAPLLLLLGAAACVLLVGCLNVAGLLLVRGAQRQRSLAVRAALGGGRAALALPVLAESGLLALAGGGLGCALAGWAGPRLLAALPQAVLGGRELRVDASVLAFALATSLAAALLAAMAPVLATTARLPMALLAGARGTGGPGRGRGRAALVVGQVALAFILVAAAGLLGRTLHALSSKSPGFVAAGVLTARLALPASGELPPPVRREVLARAVDVAAASPGVAAAGAVLRLPLTGVGYSANLRVEGRTFPPSEAPDVGWRAATPGFFETLAIPLLRGRAFGREDGVHGAPTALVNRRLAAALWPGADPIGRRIATGLDGEGWVTVVGVVGDTPQEAIGRPARLEMYRPLLQDSRFGAETMTLVARVRPGFSAATLRDALHAVSPSLVVEPLQPLADVVRRSTAHERLLAALLGCFGAGALALAAIGLYALLAYLVAERRREMSVRVALGASPRAVAAMVLRRGLSQVGLGVALGALASVAASRLLARWLYGVALVDPWTLAAALATLLGAGLLASWLPAWRAARVEAATALRGD